MSRQRRPGTIDWVKSESKQIVLDDLEAGLVSLDDTDTAEDLYYGMYQYTPEFIAENVQFQQFKARLQDHRKQIRPQIEAPQFEMAALAHDRLLTPKRTHNSRGEKIFYLTQANSFLEQDIRDNKHRRMTPSELKATRQEYAEWPLRIFDGRIRQMIRRQRFINYLNDKREEEKLARQLRRMNLGLPAETPQERRNRRMEVEEDESL